MNRKAKIIILFSAFMCMSMSGCGGEDSSSSESVQKGVKLTAEYAGDKNINSEAETTVTSQTLPRLTAIETQATKATLVSTIKNYKVKEAMSMVRDFESKRMDIESMDGLQTIDWNQYRRGNSEETTTTVNTDSED